MRDRFFSGKQIIIALLSLVFVCGCAGKTMIVPDVPPQSLENIRTIHATERIIATAQIDLMSVRGNYPVRAALILQKPSYLRLEMLPVIGTPDFFLTATPDEMRIFIPSQGEFYAGKPTAENLARFLTWALNIEDIVTILSCGYPALAGENVSYVSSEEAGLLRVDMKTPAGPSQTVWMEKKGRLVKLIRYGPDGREIYSVRYESYTQGSPLAEKITIQWADNTTSVIVKYSDLKVEKATDLSIFKLPVPSGMKIIKLD